MNPMTFQRRLAAGVALGFLFILIELFVHGFLLSRISVTTASILRSDAQMRQVVAFLILGQFIFGTMFGIVYAQGYEPRRGPLGQGLRYGVIIGLMVAPLYSLAWCMILSVPSALSVCWFAAVFSEMLVLGLAASRIYKP